MIYLDNSATTRPRAESVAAISHALTEGWGNPSSLHALGMEAGRLLTQARKDVALALGAEPDRVFFTSGGTEADNWAIFSAAKRLGKRGKHLVTTAVEHHAVLHPMKELELQGFEVTYLQPDETGTVTVEALQAALRPDTILVSVMMVCNETGAVMPLQQMIRAVRRSCPEALFHTDAVQGFLKLPFKAKSLGADLISISGHKICGPKGIGALYVRPGLNLPPLLHGGGQEKNLRSGTEPLPAIAGFGAAAKAGFEELAAELAHLTALRDDCAEKLGKLEGVQILGSHEAPHIVCLSVPGLRSQGIINCLQDRGIYVSAGSACAKGHRSHALEAMGLPAPVLDGAIRVSFGRDNRLEDVDALCDGLRHAIATLKG